MKLCGLVLALIGPFFLIAGPLRRRERAVADRRAGQLRRLRRLLGIPFIFVELRQRNRSSSSGFPRAPASDRGCASAEVRRQIGVLVLTDVHNEDEAGCRGGGRQLQTPALFARQTDFIQKVAAGQAGQHQEGPVHGLAT